MKESLINKLLEMALKDESETSESSSQNGTIKIAILQRGWIIIGRYYEDGEMVILEDSYVIRRWGTEKGLGELAMSGKQSETVLDKVGTTKFHKLTSVYFIDCKKSVWDKEL